MRLHHELLVKPPNITSLRCDWKQLPMSAYVTCWHVFRKRPPCLLTIKYENHIPHVHLCEMNLLNCRGSSYPRQAPGVKGPLGHLGIKG